MDKFNDFHEAFNFLEKHPIFNIDGYTFFNKALEIEVVKVNPETEEIDCDKKLNTLTQVWLETGPVDTYEDSLVSYSHDYDLDCGANTFEEAIIELANLVCKKYGMDSISCVFYSPKRIID